ncbi:MAG: NADH-quinone oxidoreductase subunit F [Acidimicrobiia bacterium]|nr:MAG: NADH-quinone oxidoreductase subunit F [Acidimicrobiia bacterium]
MSARPGPGRAARRVLPEAPVGSLDGYLAAGGGAAIRRARSIGPDATIDEVTAAGLRGRGGGGFPTGRKWRTVRDAPGSRRFVVVNGAEGEPGTFKDRAILRADAYQVVEGAAVAALAVGARDVYVGLKRSFVRECDALRTAAQEMAAAGMLGDLDVTIVQGPPEYLFGEEKALLEVVEGKDPLPRVLPPYQHGLFATAPQLGWTSSEPEPGEPRGEAANPTLVNNVETLAHVTWLLSHGVDSFRALGTSASPGTTVFTVSGDVTRPGVHELPLGTPLRALVEVHGGGMRPGRRVKMVCSGVANPVLPGDRLDTPMDHESLAAAGSGLGSAGFVVYDDEVCALAVARLFSRFLFVESCGQCPPCKLQSGAVTEALEEIERTGDASGLARIERALRTVTDGSRCALAAEEQQVVGSILRRFPEDVVAHEEGRCRLRHDLQIPLLADLTDTGFVLDARQGHKRPDWTYGT